MSSAARCSACTTGAAKGSVTSPMPSFVNSTSDVFPQSGDPAPYARKQVAGRKARKIPVQLNRTAPFPPGVSRPRVTSSISPVNTCAASPVRVTPSSVQHTVKAPPGSSTRTSSPWACVRCERRPPGAAQAPVPQAMVPAAPLPHAHPQAARAGDLHKFPRSLPGKTASNGQSPRPGRQVQLSGIRHEHHAMGVAHGKARGPQRAAADLDQLLHQGGVSRFSKALPRAKSRAGPYPPAEGPVPAIHRAHTRQRLHPGTSPSRRPFKNRYSAAQLHAVAAHSALAAVGVENAHFHVRHGGLFQQNQPVGPPRPCAGPTGARPPAPDWAGARAAAHNRFCTPAFW